MAVHRPHMPLSARTAAYVHPSDVKMMQCAGKVLRVTHWAGKPLNHALERCGTFWKLAGTRYRSVLAVSMVSDALCGA